MNTTGKLIGSGQAASRYGVVQTTFNRWVVAGRIPIAAEVEGGTNARLFEADVIDRLAAEYRAAKIAKYEMQESEVQAAAS